MQILETFYYIQGDNICDTNVSERADFLLILPTFLQID